MATNDRFGTFATDGNPPCRACGMQGAIYTVTAELDADDRMDIRVAVKCSCCHAQSSFWFREGLDYDPTARDLRERHEQIRATHAT